MVRVTSLLAHFECATVYPEPVSPQIRLRTDIFKTGKSDPGSMEITKAEAFLWFD